MLTSSLETLIGTDVESVMMLGLTALFAGFRVRDDERGLPRWPRALRRPGGLAGKKIA